MIFKQLWMSNCWEEPLNYWTPLFSERNLCITWTLLPSISFQHAFPGRPRSFFQAHLSTSSPVLELTFLGSSQEHLVTPELLFSFGWPDQNLQRIPFDCAPYPLPGGLPPQPPTTIELLYLADRSKGKEIAFINTISPNFQKSHKVSEEPPFPSLFRS